MATSTEKAKDCEHCGGDPKFSKAAYEKTVDYAITLLEVHRDYQTCLKYLRGVQEKFQ